MISTYDGLLLTLKQYYGVPEGSNTNKKETANKKQRKRNKKGKTQMKKRKCKKKRKTQIRQKLKVAEHSFGSL